MRLALLVLGTVVGVVSTLFGVYLVYPPAMFIVGGVALVYVGLTSDFGGKRGETARRPPRK